MWCWIFLDHFFVIASWYLRVVCCTLVQQAVEKAMKFNIALKEDFSLQTRHTVIFVIIFLYPFLTSVQSSLPQWSWRCWYMPSGIRLICLYCCFLQIWNVYPLFPAELRLPASGATFPSCHHRLQGGGWRGSGQGLPDRAEGDLEAAHQPAVWRAAHAHPRLLPLPRSHPQRGGVSEDGLQLEDEGGVGQLYAQCLLCGLCTCVVCQGKINRFRSSL